MKRPNRVQSHGTGPTIYGRKYLRNKRGETLEVSTGSKKRLGLVKMRKSDFQLLLSFGETFLFSHVSSRNSSIFSLGKMKGKNYYLHLDGRNRKLRLHSCLLNVL